MASSELKTIAKTTASVAIIITLLFLIASYLIVMVLGPALFFFTPEGMNYSVHSEEELPIWVFTIFGFIMPAGLNVGVLFLLLWGSFALCFVAAWKLREPLQETLRQRSTRALKNLSKNSLNVMLLLNCMMLIAVVAIQAIQEAGGVSTGEPTLPENPFQNLFQLSWSALFEEIGFRVIPFGIFLLVYLYYKSHGKWQSLSAMQRLTFLLKAPFFPDKAKKMIGLRTVDEHGVKGGISGIEWAMVLLTASIFGLAHYILGGGWDIGKISSASAVGVAMGITYLLYGAHAPILMHWFFNHYLWFFDAGKQGGLQFVSQYLPGLPTVFSVTELLVIGVGVLGWLILMAVGVSKLRESIVTKRSIRAMQLL